MDKIRENSQEIYIYLGNQTNTYFFIHTIYNDKFTEEISHQIYNVLINDDMIISPDENVIIYEINKNNKVNIICIQHSSKKYSHQFYKNNLEEFFSVLISKERNDIYAIKYNYETKAYYSYYIDDIDIFKNIFSSFRDKIKIDNFYYVITTKLIKKK